jgi:hypothetical protein
MAAIVVATMSQAACRGAQSGGSDRSGVTVSAHLVHLDGQLVVSTLFRPDRPGFHIYSLDLPDRGVNGLGIPTRVTGGVSLQQVSELRANKASTLEHIDQIGADLPIYPAGSVEVSMTVKLTGTATPTVMVSYGACSSTVCLPPVRDEAIQVNTN